MAKVNKRDAIALYKGGITVGELAERYECTPAAISKLLARTEEGRAAREQYRSSKAEVFEQVQVELLSAVNGAAIKDKQSLVTSAAILEDKIRLERNQVTSHGIMDIRALVALIPDSVRTD